mmetsp:Transcript_15933/g.44081  ORF Transcript_15933/g.44081 Transcript_15933/m.44081 type:complete len:83 (-) Transcript_15933:771-1019(-)
MEDRVKPEDRWYRSSVELFGMKKELRLLSWLPFEKRVDEKRVDERRLINDGPLATSTMSFSEASFHKSPARSTPGATVFCET